MQSTQTRNTRRVRWALAAACACACLGACAVTEDAPIAEGGAHAPTDGGGANEASVGARSADAARAPDAGERRDASDTDAMAIDSGCAEPAGVVVASGGALAARPQGDVLRLKLVYQGSALGITAAQGVNMILVASVAPLTPGVHSGYWFELRDSTHSLYTRTFTDPSAMEVVSADGGLSQTTVPFCSAKTLAIDIPSVPSTTLFVYGSPYGTMDPAVEIARFSLP